MRPSSLRRQARALIADWTIEQKANVTTGTGWQAGRCVGNIGAQPDIGFPNGLCLQDSPMYVSSRLPVDFAPQLSLIIRCTFFSQGYSIRYVSHLSALAFPRARVDHALPPLSADFVSSL